MDDDNTRGEKKQQTWQQLHKNATRYTEQILEATSHKTPAIRPPTSHL